MSYIENALSEISFTTNSKSSIYYNKNGIKVPRVTEILDKMIHNDALMYWANSLGMKGIRYKDAMNRAANTGTSAHSAIEHFLKEKMYTDDNIPFLGFMMWYVTITEQLNLPVEVIHIEHKMACDWFGGTLDALMKIGSRIYLVDFKTSNHIRYNYFLQLAAYRFMLRVVEGIEVDGVIVLQLDKDEPGFNEYLLDFRIMDHLVFANQCEETFLSLVYAFYNVQKVEKDYNDIFSRSD